MKSSSQCTLIIPHRVIQLTIILGPRDKAVPPTSQQINRFPPKQVKYLVIPSSFFSSFFLIHRRALCSQAIRGKVHQTGQIFPEHVEWRFLDPEYSFVAVGQISQTIFVKQKPAQLRTSYIHQILPIKNSVSFFQRIMLLAFPTKFLRGKLNKFALHGMQEFERCTKDWDQLLSGHSLPLAPSSWHTRWRKSTAVSWPTP